MIRETTLPVRKGVALLTALIILGAVSVILTTVAVQVFAQRQMARQRERQLQAQWLARAGVEQAAARLLEKPEVFSEESKDLPPEIKRRIVVEKLGEREFLITAEVQVGLDAELPVVRSASARFERSESNGVVRLQARPGSE
jgi:hypothetical protein